MPGKILVDTTPLRESRDFRLLFIGQLISMLGSQLTVVAIPYQVFTDDAFVAPGGRHQPGPALPVHRRRAGGRTAGRLPRPPAHHALVGDRTLADQRRAGRQRLGQPPFPAGDLPGEFGRRRRERLLQHGPDGLGARPGGTSPHSGGRRHDADHLPGGERRRPGALGNSPRHRPPARLRDRRRHLRGRVHRHGDDGSYPRRRGSRYRPLGVDQGGDAVPAQAIRPCRASTSSTSTPWSSACHAPCSPPWPARCSAAAPSRWASSMPHPAWVPSSGR